MGSSGLGCLLEEDAESLEAGPGSSCRGEQSRSSLARCCCRGQLLMLVGRLSRVSSSSVVMENWGEADPEISQWFCAVFEAWIPIGERFTEVLGKSQGRDERKGKKSCEEQRQSETVGSQELQPYYLTQTMWVQS